ncbi:MAG TPA: hypothetical protein VJZ75_06020 [Candidatus Bathyarchaeia archaeon]|nr:hypothetical protein [Candidatus Bathyarchaeia archaeon]
MTQRTYGGYSTINVPTKAIRASIGCERWNKENVPIAPVINGMAIPILRPSMRDSSVCLLYTLMHKSSNVQTNERNKEIKGLTIKKENTVDARMKLE